MSGMQLPPGFRPSQPQNGGSGSGGNAGPSPEEREAAESRARQQEEMKRNMIAAMLEPSARERRGCRSEQILRNEVPSEQTSAMDSSLSQFKISITNITHSTAVGVSGRRSVGEDGPTRSDQGSSDGRSVERIIRTGVKPPPIKSSAPVTSSAGGRTKSLGGGITIQRKRDDSDSDEYDL